MKFHVMWHPILHWGPREVPVLLKTKRAAVVGTKLTLKKMRDLGWSWISFNVREPWEQGGVDEFTLAEKVMAMAQSLQESPDDALKLLGDQLMEMVREDDAESFDGDSVDEGAQEDGSTTH
jgi:hypothetical protein